MGFDIEKFKSDNHRTARYERRIQQLKDKNLDVDAIEKAVDGASENLSAGETRSFVIYGEPQSGKTEMMIALTARLLDSGHKIIIHLLNDNVQLLEQNLIRFQNSGIAPTPCNFKAILDQSIKIRATDEWIIFCKKNARDLEKLIDKVGRIDGKVIIDDEADYASPNSKINRAQKTKINELIEKLLGKRGVYIGVTATPARLDLNNTFENEHEKWIDFPPHPKYTGQDVFFPIGHGCQFQLNLISDNGGDNPKYVRQALYGFFVNSAYLNLNPDILGGTKNFSFLVHTSGKKADHKRDYTQIVKAFDTLGNRNSKDFERYLRELWNVANAKYPALADKITQYILANIDCRNIVIMNSDKDFSDHYKSATSPSALFTVVVGGNIVSRGITFDNLLSMYFTRDVKHKLQQDTYIQRARMFGSRGDYLEQFELSIPEQLYLDWHKCFVFHRLALLSIRNKKGAPVWHGDKRVAAAAASSIDKTNVQLDSGEMSFEIFDFGQKQIEISKILNSDLPNLQKLRSLKNLLGEEHCPEYIISFIEQMSGPRDQSIKMHDSRSLSLTDASIDHENISRPKSFLGGAAITKDETVMHHFRIQYNANGKGRLFYRYVGKISFLKNLKKHNVKSAA